MLKRYIEITEVFHFNSCHHLPFHDGKCKNKHGHTYKLEVRIRGELEPDTSNPGCGMIMDFEELKTIVNDTIISEFDHKDLNQMFFNPTAELMAWEIHNRLSQKINKEKSRPIYVSMVRLYETPNNYVQVCTDE